MGIVKVIKKESYYTTIDTFALNNDVELSWAAKGILCYLISKPPNWETLLKDIEKRSTNKRTAVSTAMKELIDKGYVSRKRVYENGKFKTWDYTVYERSQTRDVPTFNTKKVKENLNSENLNSENLNSENLNSENLSYINIDLNINKGKVNIDSNKDKKEGVVFPFESDKFRSIWQEWRDYKKHEHRFKYKSVRSEQAALKKLANMSCDENEAIEIILESMAQGWKGFFKINKSKNGGASKTKSEPAIKKDTSGKTLDSFTSDMFNEH